ncbi:MAG: Endo-1,4-beta-xylanase A [Syntrophomonadaceae bacterium]|nr:Endo-1,4-beta-xylanase A [Bacillota bacterium]
MFSKRVAKGLVLVLVFVFTAAMTGIAAPLNGEAIRGSANIDGEIEAAWDAAKALPLEITTGVTTASVVARTMWTETNLFVLVEVTDDVLDATAANVWQRDSVEIFIDQNNAKTPTYQDDDMQLRVNFKNEVSSGGAYFEAVRDTIKTATKIVDGGWILEVSIPWTIVEAEQGTIIGFDLQYNDASDGARSGMLKWNDTTDTAWNNTSVFGNLEFVAAVAAVLPKTGSSIPVYILYGLAALLLVGGIVLQVRKLTLNK